MNGRRVYVSGVGAVSPYGLGALPLREALFTGRSAIGPIRGFDASRFATRIGGEVPPLPLEKHFDERELGWISKLAAHGVIAARLALEDAGWSDPDGIERAGVIFGTGFGSLAESGPHFVRWAEIGDAAARTMTIPVLMLNAPAAQMAMQLGLKGPALTVATACSSGSDAVGQAFREIRSGAREVMLAGGGEHALTELMLLSWSRLRVLSRRNDDPEGASRPFDADRDGLVLSDAVVLLLLESEDHLARRGGRALAEVAGYASNCDASHLTAPDEASERGAMLAALADARLAPSDIDLVCAHGTSTRRNDATEGRALRAVFANGAPFPHVAGLKSMTGHPMGASGAIGIAAAAYALEAGVVPPTINLARLDPECPIPAPSPRAVASDLRAAMVNAFAFGGHNAVIALRRAGRS